MDCSLPGSSVYGILQEEYWSGLPCPPPGQLLLTELIFVTVSYKALVIKVMKVKSLSCFQLFATPRTLQPMEFSKPEYWSGSPFPSPGDLPNPGIEPRTPTLQADSLPAEPPGKPKNTVVGNLSLLQQIFLTQELNRGLLHCRRILYQLSYQGSSKIPTTWK